MNVAHQIRIACVGIVAVAAIAALVILFSIAGRHATGAVAATTYVCPDGFKPVLVEGSGRWLQEISMYEAQGGYCTFGPDGLTPCCTRP
jgi:hypothetical protein